MWYVCDVLYVVLCVYASCLVVGGCTVSRRYIDVCNCDVFRVVNGRRYVCCSECNVVSDESAEPIPALYFRSVCFMGEHGLLNEKTV